MQKVAFFIDWDNLRKVLKKTKNIDTQDSDTIYKIIYSYLDNKTEKIYRIFFYTAIPPTDQEVEKALKSNKSVTPKDKKEYKQKIKNKKKDYMYNIAKKFLDDISKKDFVALRIGKLQVRGIKKGALDIVQKKVDMLMGLDIAEISHKRLADKILVFSKDTDVTPALKLARINGLTTMLANYAHSPYIAQELLQHSDLIRSKDIESGYLN